MSNIILKITTEVIILKKFLVIVLLLFICIFIPVLNCSAYQITSVLNNKSLSSNTAIKAEDVVMISYLDSVSSKTHNNMEIYNIDKLDAFMGNVKKGKKGTIRIVKYGRNETGIYVNKVYDLKCNGNNISDIEYDVYSNPNAFMPSKPLIFNKIIKKNYPDGIWYGICSTENNNTSCPSLISFYKSSIVDRYMESTLPNPYNSPKHSREELYQDIFMTLLLPSIQTAVNNYYKEYLSVLPTVAPYDITILSVDRVSEYRNFEFLLKLELHPYLGAHNDVGTDYITLRITDKVKVEKFEHIKSYGVPPYYENIIKKKLP